MTLKRALTTTRRTPLSGVILRLLLVLTLVNLTTGCFVSQPIEGDPAPETEVQVLLTEEAALRVSQQAQRPVGALAARVMQVRPDSLVLAVRWREIASGSSGRPGPDVVRLARSEIESIERPQFSLRKTLVLAGVAVVVAGAIVGGIMQGFGGNTDDGPGDGGPPDQN